ncbi:MULTISPECIES: type II toxin-antitoxin system Phd/YefM family antitoxin [unclassified Luteococcus]|uniref:type II toxin-antitoxin system Phd/YefM family antitoxin n=1 Tax=unclassified Luteococcus TaxID=2639923 RepID=UPI00313E435B
MKTISVGELRQNPSPMLEAVASGETYRVTRHHQEIAQISPINSSASVVAPRVQGQARTAELPRIELPAGLSIEGLLDEMAGDR